MINNLDRLTSWTRGAEYEIYDPENAWTDAPSPVFAAVFRYRGGIFQVGYDPAADKHWIRSRPNDEDAEWTAWSEFPPAPPVLPSRARLDPTPEAETSKRRR